MARPVPLDQLANIAVQEAAKKIARNVTLALEKNTPKDTGLASVSWIINYGSHLSFPIRVGNDRFQKIAFAALQKARRDTGLASLVAYNIFNGDINISNDLEYIGALEAGHSQQAPNGFLLRSVVEGTVAAFAEGL